MDKTANVAKKVSNAVDRAETITRHIPKGPDMPRDTIKRPSSYTGHRTQTKADKDYDKLGNDEFRKKYGMSRQQYKNSIGTPQEPNMMLRAAGIELFNKLAPKLKTIDIKKTSTKNIEKGKKKTEKILSELPKTLGDPYSSGGVMDKSTNSKLSPLDYMKLPPSANPKDYERIDTIGGPKYRKKKYYPAKPTF